MFTIYAIYIALCIYMNFKNINKNKKNMIENIVKRTNKAITITWQIQQKQFPRHSSNTLVKLICILNHDTSQSNLHIKQS